MSNYTSISNLTGWGRKRQIIAILSLIVLPLILGGVYVTQQYRSKANVISTVDDFFAERTSDTSALIEFTTEQPVKATLMCSISPTDVKFFCGEDAGPVTSHSVFTTDHSVNLNTGQGYYVFADIVSLDTPIGYIPADPDNLTFGLNFSMFNDDSLGRCWGEEGYDPQLDIDQDGCVYTRDLVRLYDNPAQ